MPGTVVVRSMAAAVLLLAAACSKGEGPQGAGTSGGPGQGPQEEQAVPVEKLYIELNGQTYCAFAGGGGVLLEQQEQKVPDTQAASGVEGHMAISPAAAYRSPQDTIRLQEEGLRRLRITEHEPVDAPSPVIDSIEFHHDIYTCSPTSRSITILGGSYALPDNWYLSPVGEGLLAMKGRRISGAGEARFYNYPNRSYDNAMIEVDGNPVSILWLELGRPRRFRIVFILEQEGENRFEIPFYELPNSVDVLIGETQGSACIKSGMCAVPALARRKAPVAGYVSAGSAAQENIVLMVSPGDTLQLQYMAQAPEEFNVFEWCLGTATPRYSPLNAVAVEGDFLREAADPLLTEEGMRYTLSKVHLSREGLLVVDAGWDPEKARSSGGGTFNEVPVCVIGMPAGNHMVEAMARSFTFPAGESRSFLPTPFYCNATVLIAE